MTFMNYLVFLDSSAGELEKILSGTKRMVLKNIYSTSASGQTLRPGDNLYFLRDDGDSNLRVKATVSRIMSLSNQMVDDMAHILKELQQKLQLTEEQYNHWSAKKQAQLVEFEDARKIGPIHISDCQLTERSDWMAFEDCDLISGSNPQCVDTNL